MADEFNSYEEGFETTSYSDGTSKKGKKKKSENKGDKKIIFAMVALIAAFVIFIVLTVIQNNIVKNESKTGVVVAVKDVPRGLVLTQEVIQQYFTMELRASKDLPAEYFQSGHALVGLITDREMLAKEVVTPKCLIEEDIYEGVDHPVLVSIEVAKLSHGVGGTLRAGDYIDINAIVDIQMMVNGMLSGVDDGAYSMKDSPSIYDDTVFPNKDLFIDIDGEDKNNTVEGFELAARLAKSVFNSDDFVYSATGKYASIKIGKKIRVVDVFTQAGLDTASAEADGVTKQVATVFTILVPREMEDIIYLSLEEGTLQVAKIVKPDEENDTLNVGELPVGMDTLLEQQKTEVNTNTVNTETNNGTDNQETEQQVTTAE